MRSLMNGALDWKDQVITGEESEGAYLPVSVDSSQLKAINMAAAGSSFVLHGPPGTGKSQTITALIANAVTKGKKVLFVAEKMAALEVVQKRLAALGIGDFCLELHSNKAVKKNILDQLKRGMELRVWGMATDYEKKIAELGQMRKELDGYMRKLHEVRACGRSVRSLIDLYETIPETAGKVQIDIKWARTLTQEDLEEQRKLLRSLVTAGHVVGDPSVHPLKALHRREYSQSFRRELEEKIEDYLAFAEELDQKQDLLDQVQSLHATEDRILKYKDFVAGQVHYEKCRKEFEELFTEEMLRQNTAFFQTEFKEAKAKMFLFRKKAVDQVLLDVQRYVRIPLSEEGLPGLLKKVDDFRAEKKHFEESKAQAPEELVRFTAEGGRIEDLEAGISLSGEEKQREEDLNQFLQGEFLGGEKTRKEKTEKCQALLDHLPKLKEWVNFRDAEQSCENAGLSGICRVYLNGYPADQLEDLYFKALYQELITDIIESEPVLDRFSGISFNEKIRKYKELEDQFLTLTRQEMFYRLSHDLPTDYESVTISKEMAFLRKAITSGGRGLSIRSLFDQIPNILPRLCPCFLMSPISVAQYLPLVNDRFDLVVFDEASQLPTCKAVGVLARGKNAVIVGDPNQMPPTSFFAGKVLDEDYLDTEDLDSILDDCLALGMEQTHLQWHYRSRHESLIAFSNVEYYNNSMLTFPSVNDREKRVRLCTVNGTFSRKKGRVNEEEGKAIVREIKRRYSEETLRDQSVGVITFNITQQTLIEDLLAEEFRKDEEFDRWANEKEEALFVKNLENVQGDERDVILFSVSFGPDEEGKLSLNFGPLNREGGWKRLNVAVSRARSEMIVFSSMLPEMIDLNKSRSKGVEGVKAFLEYAQKGALNYAHKSEKKGDGKGIRQQICEELAKAGYRYQKDVGHSDFRVDIAVIDPFNEEEYLLGILLDGESYRKAVNTKDREISQISVLEGLGWKVHRIWTMDWWDNKEKELEDLLGILEEQKQVAKEAALNPKKKDEGPESEEITPVKPAAAPKKERKKRKPSEGKEKKFEDSERFRPLIPHE